jgi:transcriptional regulator with XRE-family HTH domain
MAASEKAIDVGTRRAAYVRRELGLEIRNARVAHGLNQTIVARAARTSRAQISRIERGEAAHVQLLDLARLLAVLGLELSARAYPVGQPIRDAPHRALLERLRVRVGTGVRWTYERPIGGAGDLRAWDASIVAGSVRVGVEAETRLGDVQALQRRIALKLRDDDATRCALLLLADTRHNRAVLRDNVEALRADFSVDGRAALDRIVAGDDPRGNAIALL